jgi:hypothetical protein
MVAAYVVAGRAEIMRDDSKEGLACDKIPSKMTLIRSEPGSRPNFRQTTKSCSPFIHLEHHIHVYKMVHGVKIHSNVALKAQEQLFADDALKFLAALHRTFESTRQSLLTAREDAQRRYDSGVALDFPPETVHIRAEPSWHCVPPAPGLEDRRIEITGPTDRKMVINALNSGAKTFMADFEGT